MKFLRALGLPFSRIKWENALDDFTTGEYRFNILIAMIIGVVGGYGAVGFRHAISLVEKLAFGIAEPGVHYLIALPWYLRLTIPVIGALIVGPIITFFASEAKGHGVPEVMASVATRGGIIRGRVAAAKVVASAVTIGTGGSAGSEGPIVQIGSSIASLLGQILHVGAQRLKTFVGCGAAAGIAATFNAPVAGMLFALEIVLGNFGPSQMSSIIVSSVVATAVSRMHLGDAPAFAVPEYVMKSPIELIHYAFLGVLAGIAAVTFTRVLDGSETFFEKLKFPEWLKPSIGGLMIGLIGAAGFPHVYGVGYEFIEEALLGHLPLMMLGALVLAKIIATAATLGSGGSGGIFAPSLFIGAMLGGVAWYIAHAITPDLITPNYGAYSLVGMAAVVAATTHAPMQAILILFELTGGYEVILPLMLSSILAMVVSKGLLEESIYTIKLKAKGIVLSQGKEINVMKGIKVGDIMRSEKLTIPHNMRLRPLFDIISNDKFHSTFFILDKKDRLKAFISYTELRAVLFDVETLEQLIVTDDIANRELATVTPEDTLDVAFHMFSSRHLDELPVVDIDDESLLIGTLHRHDVIDAYNNEIMMRDLMGSVTSSLNVARKIRSTALSPGFSMAELELPSHFVGKNLRNLDLRNKQGIEVFLVRRNIPGSPGKSESLVPNPDLTLETGDVILVSGPKEVVESLARK